ncbi:MAG: DUF1501 domain-containing protein [Actinomycetota bacterium]
MLDHDISSADSLRLLTAPDRSPNTLDRRRFLQLVGMGVGAGLALNSVDQLLPARVREAWALAPAAPHDGIIVLLGLFGGMDGLNVVVPYSNPTYYAQHGAIAIPANKALHLNSAVGLHPNLTFLKSLYDQGHVAVVQGVGYPDPDESHFNSMAYWMAGRPNSTSLDTGWIGRWLDNHKAGLFGSIAVGGGLPLHLLGATQRGVSVPEWGGGFAAGSEPSDKLMYDAIRAFSKVSAGQGAWHDSVAAMMKNMVDVGQAVGPVFDRPLPDSELVKKMTVAARLINADLGVRVLDTGYDGFDNHSGEPATLIDQMTQLDRALKAFFTTLDDRLRSRVTIMTYSEFGRTSYSNDSLGTDHGTANNHFVIGHGVKGGLYGHQPSLTGLQRWDRVAFNVDFRSMYASVLDGWMGGGSSVALGGSFPNLGLFARSPGEGIATGAVPPNIVGDYVSLAPARLYDSRSSRQLPLGDGTTGEVQVLGKGGVPLSGVSAVALHVTALGGTTASHFTAWPTGAPRPDVANVMVPTMRPQPALVIVKTGQAGRVNVGNDLGSAHCVVDVVGYFRPAAANRLQTIAPFRALDTRKGVGGPRVALGAGATRSVAVRGLKGVPVNADSVVLNITVLGATTTSSLTVYPSGTARPAFSAMNFVKGAVVPNLVIAKVGHDSTIAVYNAAGSVHVVIDVVGYLAPNAHGRFVPLTPGRALSVTGMTASGATPTSVRVSGVNGVPATGVQAVILNVAARNATAPTGISVWSSGGPKALSSAVNVSAAVDGANLVIVRPGVGGKIVVSNAAGTVDVAVDAVGYFTA